MDSTSSSPSSTSKHFPDRDSVSELAHFPNRHNVQLPVGLSSVSTISTTANSSDTMSSTDSAQHQVGAHLRKPILNRKAHRNSIAMHVDNERKHKQDLKHYMSARERNKGSSISGDSTGSQIQQTVIYLPRGGIYVSTPAGPIQFG